MTQKPRLSSPRNSPNPIQRHTRLSPYLILGLIVLLALCTAPAMAETLTITADGYTYFGTAFTISSSDVTYIISASGTTGDTIIIEAGTAVNVTLNGVEIDVRGIDNACAFAVTGNAVCNLTLIGDSILHSGAGRAGLQVEHGAVLNSTAASSGTLTATGGDGGAGIGGGEHGDSGTITIEGGTITAIGGAGAAALGGGFGGTSEAVTILGGTVHTVLNVHHTHEGLSFTNQLLTGGDLPSGTYLLFSDLTENLNIPAGADTALCLNGYTLTSASGDSVITVSGNLTLCDCQTTGNITGATNTQLFNGGIYLNGGNLTMYNGTITGNHADFGGGISIDSGSVALYGGTISGNTAYLGGGIYLNTQDTVTLYGGTITGNTARSKGGGIYVYQSFVELSGTPTVTGNTAAGEPNNVYLSETGTDILTIIGDLDSTAQIGVTTESNPYIPGIPITGVWTADLSQRFIADNTAYYTHYDGSVVRLAAKAEVTITGGENMTCTSGNAHQTAVAGAITPIIFTAETGYCFNQSLSPSIHGLVFTVSTVIFANDTLTIAGTPDTKTVSRTLANAEKSVYPVTWIDGDGRTLAVDRIEYGETPMYSGTTPTKTETAEYTYTFTGWTPAISPVTGPETYTAVFDAIPKYSPPSGGGSSGGSSVWPMATETPTPTETAEVPTAQPTEAETPKSPLSILAVLSGLGVCVLMRRP